MRDVIICALVLVIGAGAARPARAQSLADLAKKEEERRKANPSPANVITNDDLGLGTPEAVERRLLNTSAPDKPRVAASIFFGYYLRSTRGYAAYCQRVWAIDLAAFVNAFKSGHRSEYARATAIVASAGSSEEKMWSQYEPTINQTVEHEMSDLTSHRESMEACRGLNAGAETLAAELHFSKVFPQSHAALMSTPGRR